MNSKRRKISKSIRGGYKVYKKPSVFSGGKIKEKTNIKLPFGLIKASFYLAAFLTIIFLFFFSNKFAVKDVIVEGNNIISTDKIESYIPVGDNIFRFNIKKTSQTILSENPEIKNVQILRGIPDAVKVIVLEHDNKLVWQTGNDKYLISSQGEVTKKINEGESFNLPIVIDLKNFPITIGSRLVSPSFIAFVLNLNDKFFEYTNIKPVGFEIPDTTFDVNLKTEAGFYVKFNTMRSSTKQLENLKKILVEKRQDIHEYVDLRIDGWGYYK